MAQEEMKKVEETKAVEEAATNEVEELKKLLAEAKGLLEAQNKPQEEKKEDEKPKGFFGRIGYYCTHTSLRDAASDAGKVLLGGGAIAAAVFGGKYLYDSRKRDQLPEKYVPSEVVDNDTLE